MNTKLGFTATMLTVGLLTAPVLAADREDYKAFSSGEDLADPGDPDR